MHGNSRRILAIWLRRLSTDRLTRQSRARSDQPLVVVAEIKSARRISALNDEAAALGLRHDMPLADARAMYPALQVADADPQADAALLTSIGEWCNRYTPLAGLDPPDGLFLDISGCAHLFGGEEDLRRDLMWRLSRQGFQVRAAIADNPGCAWAAARHTSQAIVPRGGMRSTLSPLPLAALRLPRATVDALMQVGLRYIRDVLDRPRAPLAARFGADFLRRLDQALGVEDEAITPLLPVPRYLAERRFPEPIAREEDVMGTIAQLAGELKTMLERRGEGARKIELSLFRADGKVSRIAVSASEALRDPERIQKLFAEKLSLSAPLFLDHVPDHRGNVGPA